MTESDEGGSDAEAEVPTESVRSGDEPDATEAEATGGADEDIEDMEWIHRHGSCSGPPSSEEVLQAVADFVDDLVDDAADGDPPAPTTP